MRKGCRNCIAAWMRRQAQARRMAFGNP
ncbi:MAG: DUF1244 domain-containing protein [Gemmatimonadetes bacterium]|nr:DUF1244 domain-containing protein [Gemmatimonadota bacterium]